MYPVTITVHNDDQLKAVHSALQGVTTEAPAAPAAGKGRTKAADKAPAASTATPPETAAPAAAAVPALSAEGKAFLNNKLAAPVMELSQKDEPKMKAICAEYGVERVSLIPEKLFPEVLVKVLRALDPGAEERERLEKLDKSRSLI